MDVAQYNRKAWDRQVEKGNRWTLLVTPRQVAAARQGDWQVVLTPQRPVPKSWFPPIEGSKVLGLACGGGQQAPILAAAGALVTVVDNSPRQLDQDQVVAQREGLQIRSVLGDMRDLSNLDAESFDVVFNPCSLSFVPDARAVFREVYRVLRPGGVLMCGFTNPLRYLFDEDALQRGEFNVRFSVPYSDEAQLTAEELAKLRSDGEPLVFGHTLEDLVGGQLRAGLVVRDLYEDRPDEDPLAAYVSPYMATLAERLPG